MRVPVRIAHGSAKNLALPDEQMGRGTGSRFVPAIVEVVTSATKGKQVVATMDVPADFINVPDEELIRRFVEGFIGSAVLSGATEG